MAGQTTFSIAMSLWVIMMLMTAMLLLLNVKGVHGGRPLLKQPDMLQVCTTPLFVFGASYMDVGENSAAMPFRENSEFPPYGIDYFGRPTGRFSNGRLVIDHICSSMSKLPQPKDFHRGVYILESGNNDYYIKGNYLAPLAADELVAAVVDHIRQAIQILYNEGARTIVAMNAFPTGCFPTALGQSWVTPSSLDEDGCVASSMHIIALHNKALQNMIENLQTKMVDAKLVIFDLHQIFMDAIRNPASVGLKHVHRACCGYGGGDYNYNDHVRCGRGGFVDGKFQNASVCEDRSSYMIWDGLHPTDRFSHHIAKAFVNGAYMQPSFFIKQSCMDPTSFPR